MSVEKQQTREITRLQSRIADLEHQLAEARQGADRLQLFASLFDLSSEGVVLLRPDYSFHFVSRSFQKLTGTEHMDLVGESFSTLLVGLGSEGKFRQIAHALHKEGSWKGEVWSRSGHGNRMLMGVDIYRLNDESDPQAAFGGLVRDVTMQREHEEELWHKSRYDQLTELPNWNLFLNKFVESLFRGAETDTLTAFVFIDLDGFKMINDTLGHTIGDKVLREVAECFTDALPEKASLARFSGDEFVAVLPEMENRDEASKLADSLQKAIERPIWVEDEEIHLSCSMGVSIYPGDGEDLETLVRNADSAMHKAKEEGRRCYRFFSSDMDSRAQARRVLENRLRRAIDMDQLSMMYQPIVDVGSGHVVKAESLMRWRDPEVGIVSPGQFVPLAEEIGLIKTLGEIALRKSIAAAANWSRLGVSDVGVAVNVSAQQFEGDGLADFVDRELAKTGLSPKLLTLEITESAILEDSESNLRKMNDLRELGIQLAIDDFGTGYSSLAYIRKFNVDFVKIDQVFVRDIISNQEDASMVSAIISMSDKMKIACVAEGVETEEQQRFLEREGCQFLQGYYFSRPLGESAFLDYLRQTGRYNVFL